MSGLRRFLLRISALIRHDVVENDLAREVDAHLTLLEDEHRRRGLTPDEARVAARRALGSIALAKDLHRDARSFAWLEDVRRDLRHGLRGLRRAPGFTITAVLTMALGIGAATATFSVAYGVLLRPLPYSDSDRLVRIWEEHPGGQAMLPDPMFSNVSYYAWDGRGRTVGPLGAFSNGTYTIGAREPIRVAGASLSPSLFQILRVSAQVGRLFTDEDAREGATPVVVLSDGFWRERFGRDPGAVGRTLEIDATPHLIVGIARSGFAFPDEQARLWTPETVPHPTAGGGNQRVFGTAAIARLSAGATPAQAEAEGTSIVRAQSRPPVMQILWGKGGPVEVRVRPLVNDMTKAVRPVLVMVAAAVLCLLLIACANVANLSLSRGVVREREVSVRAALGAGRGRIVRQLLTESMLTALLGGALGVALAFAVVRVLPALVPLGFPRMDAVRLDWVTMGFAAVATGVSGVLSGVAPAFRSARADVLPALREGAGGSAGPRASGARQSLLITEAALAVMLLVAALLVGRSLGRLMDVDAGYDADNVLTARVYLPGATEGRAQTDAFVAQLLERLRAVPDVVAAGAGGMAPFGDSTMATALTIPVPGRESVVARSRVYVVTPGYAEALRLRLRAGRLLDEADFASSSQSLLVNEEFVRTFLQGGVRPLGFTIDSVLARGVRAEIVGVVGNVLKEGLRATVQPEVYVVPAHRYNIRSEIHVLVRTARDPSALAGTLRGLVRELRADAAIDRVTTLAAQVSESVGTEQSATTTLRGLALAAMLLAAVGLYGVLSHLVSTREREIGVRAALGATRRQIAWLVVGDGLGTTIVGLLIGLAAAAGVTRLMKALLFGIDPLDPVSFVLAAMGLSVVSLVSCALAARRATRVDPLVALRSE